MEERLTHLELKVEGLPSIWENHEKRARRAQDAAKKARNDASEKLDQLEEILESSEIVSAEHENGLDSQRMLPMSTGVGTPLAPDLQERFDAVRHLL